MYTFLLEPVSSGLSDCVREKEGIVSAGVDVQLSGELRPKTTRLGRTTCGGRSLFKLARDHIAICVCVPSRTSKATAASL